MNNREILVKQLFIGKVAEIIGDKKTVELLGVLNDEFFKDLVVHGKIPENKSGLTFEEFQKAANEFSDRINKVRKFREAETLFDFETTFGGFHFGKPLFTPKLKFENTPPNIPFTAESMFDSVKGLNESTGEMQNLIDWANNFSKASREDINNVFDMLRNLSILDTRTIKKANMQDIIDFNKSLSDSLENTRKFFELLLIPKKIWNKKDLSKSISEAKQEIIQSNLSFEILKTEMQLSKYLSKNLINQIKEKQPDKFKCLTALKAELKFLVDRYGKI